ncbi:intraflagellar transport-associated protein [Oncorhynchus mykiss]|uniref:Intraflagellar transport associated protein n=1 Tax=Oncorhynchus mykiss TaxID=8022 RepID=A0A8C7LXT3_ONCMY|nr:intraflagellar transport-associated protein [Oncorhynchus mykiss]XP_021428848.2 intraflagellar transport-associated protein [Oncorhynchus mykiss]XP_021428853.2 intraflagellar transport-associated protein [Oncorhynchus mykiss]
MPGVESGSGGLADDKVVLETLKCFCSSSEQTYDQFLSSFTHLTPGSAGRGHTTLPSGPSHLSREMERSGELRRNGEEDAAEERRGQQSVCVLPADQEEVELGAGVTVGSCGNGDCRPPGITLKLDNYLDVGDFSEEEGDVTADPDGGVRVLPGEVEEELPAYLPSFCHLTQLDLTSTGRTTGTRPGTRGQQQDTPPQGQSDSEEVLPFNLDENFDYDNVVLSSKHLLPQFNTGV